MTLQGSLDGSIEPVERFMWPLGAAGRQPPELPPRPLRGTPIRIWMEWPVISTPAKNGVIPDRRRRARVTSELVGLHYGSPWYLPE